MDYLEILNIAIYVKDDRSEELSKYEWVQGWRVRCFCELIWWRPLKCNYPSPPDCITRIPSTRLLVSIIIGTLAILHVV